MKIIKMSLYCLLTIFMVSSCKNNTPKPNPALASIDLQRGELLLCSTEPFGDVSFAIDCNYDVRATFDLAISLLHSFEYAEAEKAFVNVIDMDPDCAMAYWGVAMSIYHSLWAPPGAEELEKGSKLIEIAQSLPKTKSAQQYLDAIGAFYKDWKTTDHHSRELLYEKKMEDIYLSNKDDAEATVFYALAIRSVADPNDTTYARQKKSGKMLEELFVEKPNHPGIAHYIIHNYDYPELAEMGLTTARRYAEIAPASAHAQHMPSHIFTRLGLWQESIDTNINSAYSATCYAESVNPEANWSQEIHAVDYLVYAYLQMGDNQKAMEQLKEMQAVKDVFPKNDFAATYALAAMPVRWVLENKKWKEAANLELPAIDFPWDKLYWEKSMFHFGRALGSCHIGDITSAENELQKLQAAHQGLVDLKDSYKAGQVMIQMQAVEGWIQLAKGNHDEALRFMRNAVVLENQTSKHPVTPGEVLPADELLGDMLLALKKPAEALAAYEINLKGHPNRFNGVYGAAIAAKKAGDQEKATLYFEQLIALTKKSNSDRPELAEAHTYLKGINKSS
jgi:tetratricopeptide (TPR) repeat protein